MPGTASASSSWLIASAQVAADHVVFRHVVVGIGDVAGGVRGHRRVADLLGRRRHVVEQVEQHFVRPLRVARAHQRLGVAHRDRHVAREQPHRVFQRLARIRRRRRRRAAPGRAPCGRASRPGAGRAATRASGSLGGLAGLHRGRARDRTALRRWTGQVSRSSRARSSRAGLRTAGVSSTRSRSRDRARSSCCRGAADRWACGSRGRVVSAMRSLVTGWVRSSSGMLRPAAAGALLHGLEELRHAVRVEPARRQHADADAVGFVLRSRA